MSAKRKTRLGLLAGLVALGVLMLPASRIATGADQIVIRGAESGSPCTVKLVG